MKEMDSNGVVAILRPSGPDFPQKLDTFPSSRLWLIRSRIESNPATESPEYRFPFGTILYQHLSHLGVFSTLFSTSLKKFSTFSAARNVSSPIAKRS